MKKLIPFSLFFFSVLSVTAQAKVTKTGVLGKWNISAVEMTGMFYYSVDKDSLGIGNMMKAQIKDEQQLTLLTNSIKPQLSVFTKMSFTFNADGTAELDGGLTAVQSSATYTVDEEKSTITTKDKDQKEDVLSADMVEDKLRIKMVQPQGEIMMILKKAKL